MTEQTCIFCKLGHGDIPAEKLFDDGAAFAVHDISPKAPVHVLVIPHAHIEELVAATDEQRAAAAHCLAVAPRIARQLDLAATGYRLVANQGPDSGQEIPHFHIHLLGQRSLGAMG